MTYGGWWLFGPGRLCQTGRGHSTRTRADKSTVKFGADSIGRHGTLVPAASRASNILRSFFSSCDILRSIARALWRSLLDTWSPFAAIVPLPASSLLQLLQRLTVNVKCTRQLSGRVGHLLEPHNLQCNQGSRCRYQPCFSKTEPGRLIPFSVSKAHVSGRITLSVTKAHVPESVESPGCERQSKQRKLSRFKTNKTRFHVGTSLITNSLPLATYSSIYA